VRKRHPEISLVIVGDGPASLNTEPGVRFTGFLNKEVKAERSQFQQIMSRLLALVHPTRSDIAPLAIIEASYHGCPVIASRAFAVPEIINDGETGLLLNNPSSVDEVAKTMTWLIEHRDEYQAMRQAAWRKAHRDFTRQKFEERLISRVTGILREERVPTARSAVLVRECS
jgi:glycosyltransferase involved in cell wall biosynthesis